MVSEWLVYMIYQVANVIFHMKGIKSFFEKITHPGHSGGKGERKSSANTQQKGNIHIHIIIHRLIFVENTT